MLRKRTVLSMLLFSLLLAGCASQTAIVNEPLPETGGETKPTPVMPAATIVVSPTAPVPMEEQIQATPTSPAATAAPTQMSSLEDFQARLYQALSERNFPQLQEMMDPQFRIGYWKGEGAIYTPDEAVQALDTYLTSAYRLTFEEQANLTGLLEGMDPFTILDPAVQGVKAVLVAGWGAEGKDQAILYIMRGNDNQLYWHGVLIALDGFSPRTAVPQPITVNETEVGYILVKEDVNVRSGPGQNYPVLTQIAGGQIARVTGVSTDSGWWRVICADDTVGSCWVSADRSITEPTDPPGSSRPDEQEFENELLEALRDHNFEGMRSLMGDTFLSAYWRSEGELLSREEAVSQLRQFHILPDSDLTFELDRDLSKILEGNPATVILGPDVAVYKAIYVSGLGMNGENDAILYIARRSDGSLYWHGMLSSRGGFADTPSRPFPVAESEVKLVYANLDLTIYSGPGNHYPVIGEVASGMSARVTGISMDRNWWRVICPDDTIGDCWVTADPYQSKPVE